MVNGIGGIVVVVVVVVVAVVVVILVLVLGVFSRERLSAGFFQ